MHFLLSVHASPLPQVHQSPQSAHILIGYMRAANLEGKYDCAMLVVVWCVCAEREIDRSLLVARNAEHFYCLTCNLACLPSRVLLLLSFYIKRALEVQSPCAPRRRAVNMAARPAIFGLQTLPCI